MSSQTGRVLKRKLGALRSRGYSFPLQGMLAGAFEYAAAKGASAMLGVPVEATVTDATSRRWRGWSTSCRRPASTRSSATRRAMPD